MKPRKESEKPVQSPSAPVSKKPSSNKTVQELTDQVSHIIGKNPDKAAKIIENWVQEPVKTKKQAS